MYFAKMLGNNVDVLLWDNVVPYSDASGSVFEQHCELRVGRRSLYVVANRYSAALPADQCNALVSFKGPLQDGLQVTLLRRWYIGVTVEPKSSLRADLEWAAEDLADSPAV